MKADKFSTEESDSTTEI